MTHERGLLGSQGDYNRRHRRLCQPPFRSPAILERFSGVVVDRWVVPGGTGQWWQRGNEIGLLHPLHPPTPPLLRRASHVADSFARHAAEAGGPFRANVAVQTQRLTLDVVGLTAFSHDFQQCAQIARSARPSHPDPASPSSMPVIF